MADAQGGIPEFFPAHLIEGLAVELDSDAGGDVGGSCIVRIDGGGDTESGGDGKALAMECGQVGGFASGEGAVGVCDVLNREDCGSVSHSGPPYGEVLISRVTTFWN